MFRVMGRVFPIRVVCCDRVGALPEGDRLKQRILVNEDFDIA